MKYLENQKMTTAQKVAQLMGGDGLDFKSPSGQSLTEVCGAHGARKYTVRDCIVYEFDDGSAIVAIGGAWDIRHSACECGACWDGGGTAPQCSTR